MKLLLFIISIGSVNISGDSSSTSSEAIEGVGWSDNCNWIWGFLDWTICLCIIADVSPNDSCKILMKNYWKKL